MKRLMTVAVAATVLGGAMLGAAASPTMAAAKAAQNGEARDGATRKAAMAKLAFMHGEWRGPAGGINPDRSRFAVTQTERIGPMLDGDILVIEGRGYNPDGTTGFNAFAVISWDAETDAYEIRSYARGHAGAFPLTLTDNGYVWQVPAGPGTMRYEADVTDTTFHEVGDFVMPGLPPQRAFEMTLTRLGDTDWPGADPVSPTP